MAPAFMRPLSLPHCEGEFPLIPKMNATSASTHALPDALLAAFISFPAPLALLDAQGRTTLVNSRFRSQFSESAPAAAALRTLAQNPDGIWQSIPLAPLEGRNPDAMHLTPPAADTNPGVVRVRAIRAGPRVLLIVEDPDSSATHAELEAMHAHIAELETRASTDHLTGVWNRAHLDQVLEAELVRSMVDRQPLSLILFDIDHFKRINDMHGHAAGDSVLRELVQLARTRLRATDILFRWGGEEFVVLVSSTGYRRAEGIAENLRTTVAGHSFTVAGTVTISLGVAEHNGDEDAHSWFRRMDAALYEAKESGRNRTVVSRRGNSDAWAAEGGASALHLTWQEGYECGDATIDGEHQELFRLANTLIDASLQAKADPKGMNSLLDQFLQHVQRHFADEEAILSRLNYGQLAEHQRAHEGLVRRALTMAARFESGDGSVGELVEFLAQDVVARHLIAVDRAFFPLIARARGQATAIHG